jgi:HAD superfamily hydrolase (TIGR01509 family)
MHQAPGSSIAPPPAGFVFDLMDTVIVDPFFDTVLSRFPAMLEKLASERDPDVWPAFERGELDEEDFMRRFYRRATPPPGLPTAAQLRELIVGSYRFVAGMEQLLGALKAAGFALWVLSNYPIWYRIARRELALDRFFAGYAVSCDIGARKPDDAAYQALIAITGHPLDRLVLIDDRGQNCKAADRLGMTAIKFEGKAALWATLCSHGWL